jgi:hypothetical protein
MRYFRSLLHFRFRQRTTHALPLRIDDDPRDLTASGGPSLHKDVAVAPTYPKHRAIDRTATVLGLRPADQVICGELFPLLQSIVSSHGTLAHVERILIARDDNEEQQWKEAETTKRHKCLVASNAKFTGKRRLPMRDDA